MAEKSWLATHLPESVVASCGVLSAWWAQRGARIRSLGRRVTTLERDQVERHQDIKNEMSEMRESFNASLKNEHYLIVQEIDKRFDDVKGTQQLILDKLIPGASER